MLNEKVVSALSDVTVGSVTLYSALCFMALVLACLAAIKILLAVSDRILAGSRLDGGIKSFVRSAIKVLLWIVTGIILADKLGVDTTSFVALLSVAGLALSLSVQGVMTNLFSGFTILAAKPFSVGDYVQMDGASGTVREIGLFYTTVTTLDNKTIFIPNGQVTSAKIENFTRQQKRRIDLNVTASYDNTTEEVKRALLDAALGVSRVLKEPEEPFAGLLAYGDSSVEYVLRAWVKKEDYWDAYFAINEAIRELFDQRGIEMTYNHLNVHLDRQP